MPRRNYLVQKTSEYGVAPSVIVHPKKSDQPLKMIVYKCVIEFWICVLGRIGCDAMPRQEREVHTRGCGQGRWMDTKTTQVAHDEPQEFPGDYVEAKEHILSMCFERHAIINQWGK